LATNPVATNVLTAVQDWLEAESNAGRITPAVKDLLEYVDWRQQSAFPCVVSTFQEIAFDGPQTVTNARLLLRACLVEPTPKHVQREVLNFAFQIVRALNRKQGKFAGATLQIQRIRPMQMPREGIEPVHYAEIEYTAKFHENNGEQ